MANPPPKKTTVSESEVIDPHLKIVCELKDENGNAIPYDDAAITDLISNLSVKLKQREMEGGNAKGNTKTHIPQDSSYDIKDFKELANTNAKNEEFSFSVANEWHCYHFDPHSNKLYIYLAFEDAEFGTQKQFDDEWQVNIKAGDEELYSNDFTGFFPEEVHSIV